MRKPSKSCRIVKSSLLALFVLGLTVFAQTETEGVRDFNARIKSYMELQKRVSSNVPPLATTETDPAKIAIRTKALANGIQHARASAKPGDVFSAQTAREFRQVIRDGLQGKQGAPSRDTVKTGNPTEEEGASRIVLAVNTPYPDTAPRSSVPASLLLNLPQLPKGLEYRFLGRHLILLDSMANLIVDYLLDVVPKA
jgi:hypothetical protein